jgi:hypothetical protein
VLGKGVQGKVGKLVLTDLSLGRLLGLDHVKDQSAVSSRMSTLQRLVSKLLFTRSGVSWSVEEAA